MENADTRGPVIQLFGDKVHVEFTRTRNNLPLAF